MKTSIQITSGAFKNRRIAYAPCADLRPTCHRVRHAIFNILMHRFYAQNAGQAQPLRGLRVLDLYAGVGGYGLQALSLGAEQAIFVDNNPQGLRSIQDFAQKVGCQNQVHTIMASWPQAQARVNQRLKQSAYMSDVTGAATLAPHDIMSTPCRSSVSMSMPAPISSSAEWHASQNAKKKHIEPHSHQPDMVQDHSEDTLSSQHSPQRSQEKSPTYAPGHATLLLNSCGQESENIPCTPENSPGALFNDRDSAKSRPTQETSHHLHTASINLTEHTLLNKHPKHTGMTEAEIGQPENMPLAHTTLDFDRKTHDENRSDTGKRSFQLNPQELHGQADMIFLDPPYTIDPHHLATAVNTCQEVLAPQGIVVVEYPRTWTIPAGWRVVDQRQWGPKRAWFLQKLSAAPKGE